MLPSIPPGVAPLIQPQYIMSQGLPMYQPAFTLNYDDLQFIQRGIHPHMVCPDLIFIIFFLNYFLISLVTT